jgi:deoxyribodipyrimidine photo-lyase
LLIFEALRVGYPWASDRLHRFVLHGMAANARYCKSRGIRYLAYVEPAVGAGKALLRAVAEDACVVVTDDFLPRMVASAAKQLKILLEEVDSNGLLPATSDGACGAACFRLSAILLAGQPEALARLPIDH